MSDILSEKIVFGGRFELVEELGRGSQGITYLARETGAERRVAVKKLAVGDSLDWKSIELFEREGQVLKSLNHPGIPRYIDAFHEVEDGSERERFVLVQEYVSGEDLGALIEQGLRMDEAGTREFLEQMLEILVYLHALDPPVIHRDIKPSNIMRRADGRWVLIDFGGVQVVAGDTDASVGASTVVGTSGYMPFEQLMGRAVAASDLYSLGATVVHLLSHRHPSDLPVDEEAYMRLMFRDFVTTSAVIVDVLEGMLEPLLEERIGSAEVALGVLAGEFWEAGASGGLEMVGQRDVQVFKPLMTKRRRRMKINAADVDAMQVVVDRGVERLRFEVRRRGSSSRPWELEEYTVAMIAMLGIGITVMRAFYLYVNPSMGVAFGVGVLCSLVSAVLFRGWMRMKYRLEISADEVRMSGGLLGVMRRRVALDRIHDVNVVPKGGLHDKELGYVIAFALDGGEKVVRFGTGQTLRESEWVAKEIWEAIDGYRGAWEG